MSYDYPTMRYKVFREEGQTLLFRIFDHAQRAIALSGSVTSGSCLKAAGTADAWDVLACIDRIAELGYLHEITGPDTPGQTRVFVAGQRWRPQ